MNAAQECYDRLIAARRQITPLEQAETEKNDAAQRQRVRINRRLPKVW